MDQLLDLAAKDLGEVIGKMPKAEHDFILGMAYSALCKEKRQKKESNNEKA